MNKIKQVELARAVGTTEAMLSYILSGARRPSYDLAKKLGRATDTDPFIWMEYNTDKMRKAMKDARQAV